MKLGELVEEDNPLLGLRDAFHVACVLCEMDYDNPVGSGMYVRFTGDSFTKVRAVHAGEQPHGIVDPFIPAGTIMTPDGGKLFWVLLMPGLTGPPRHEFDVKIDDADEKGEWRCQGCQ